MPERAEDLLQPATRADLHRLRNDLQATLGNLTNEIRTQNGRVTRLEEVIHMSPPPVEVGKLLAQFGDALVDISELRHESQKNHDATTKARDDLRAELNNASEKLQKEMEKTSSVVKWASGVGATLVLVVTVVPWDKVLS